MRSREGLARPSRGFTLAEILIVALIVVLLTAATLAVVLPALGQQKVSSAALLMQAEINRARDEAIRANAPRGIRLVPEPSESRFAFVPPGMAGALTSTPGYARMIAIEPAPDYSEGKLIVPPIIAGASPSDWRYDFAPLNNIRYSAAIGPGPSRKPTWVVVAESKYTGYDFGNVRIPVPNAPTSWFWNVRQGDKIRIGNTGRRYTIVGPMLVGPPENPERFINWGPPSSFQSAPNNAYTEFLILLDNQDDNIPPNGYIDEQADGINNDGDVYPAMHPLAGQAVIDPGFNRVDDNQDGNIDEPIELFYTNGGGGEYEPDQLIGVPAGVQLPYTIQRQPLPAPGARELVLPTDVVIDMTTWNAAAIGAAQSPPMTFISERSRLPVDTRTGFIEFLVAPDGRIVAPGAGTITPMPYGFEFLHFWITDTEDVYEPVAIAGVPYLLPMPEGGVAYPHPNDSSPRFLRRERRLVSVNTRTGQITTSTAEDFDATSTATLIRPYLKAQQGVKDQP